MSGPKRGIWYIPYDPTPTRLSDLKRFVSKQDAWLKRHGSFIERYLGSEAVANVQAVRNHIDEYIKARDPGGGFDAYGDAWALFNQLYHRAMSAKRKQDRWEHQERLKQKWAATRLVSECKALWECAQNQALLKRWIHPKKLQSLETSLQSMAGGTPAQIKRKAKAWQREFDRAYSAAAKASEENTKSVQNCIPRLREALEALGKLNVDILPDTEQFRRENERLQKRADDAISKEDLPVLVQSINSLNELVKVYEQKVRKAQFKKATEAVHAALSKCGYTIASRTEAKGTVILQASGFPFKAVNVEMNPDSPEMRLDINDERGTRCVKDVQSLQAELIRQGMELRIIDWGKGKPQAVHQCLDQNLNLGGAR